MKAYRAWDNGSCESYSTIVFAENSRAAKKIAVGTEACEDAEYIDVRVQRLPAADKLYRGRDEIDWWDQETRLVLVRDLGWQCEETSWECENCAAKEYCPVHEEWMDMIEAENEPEEK